MTTIIAVVLILAAINRVANAVTHYQHQQPQEVYIDNDGDAVCCDDNTFDDTDDYGVPDDGVDYEQYFIDDGGPIFGD